MRHCIHILWVVPFLGVAALGADELPQPKKDPAVPAPFPVLPRPQDRAPPGADAAELQRLLRDVRSQRESLHNERSTADRDVAAPGPLTGNEDEIARLRRRMQDLAARARSRSEGGPPVLLRPSEGSPASSAETGGGALDAMAVAQNYFRAGDYETALAAYRKVPLRDALAEERAPTLYMIATCLRKLGKRDEAAKVYREVAGIKGDPFVAECAQWQLQTLAWRTDVEAQLGQLRERRKGLGAKP